MNGDPPASARMKPYIPTLPPTAKPAPRRVQPPKSARVQAPTSAAPTKRKRNPIPTRRPLAALSPVISNAPITPQQTIARFSAMLTEYEKKEIHSFPEIYYLGNKARKIVPNTRNPHNYGFDDADHNYKLMVGDHLAYRFEILALFGAGAFGQVARCFDHRTKQPTAVKIIVNTDQMHEQGQIEAKILAKLNKLDPKHIVRAQDFFIFRAHICITFEILGINLYELSENNDFKPFPARLIRLYSLQCYSALEQIHRLGIVHCDIKPENILLVPQSNSLVKIIDFGSSCFDGSQKYEYIQSRFYRAPEILLGLPYGAPMDVWSMALVLIELLIGRPLFPGDDELEQLWYITELIGLPPPRLVNAGKRKHEFFDKAGCLKTKGLSRKFTPRSIDLTSELNTRDTQLVDFLLKCLTWDQNTRLTANQAMSHVWMRTKEFQVESRQNDPTLPEINGPVQSK